MIEQEDDEEMKNPENAKKDNPKRTQSLKHYNQSIIVNLGDDEYDVGKIKIT
jgi:hypothetical protein